MILEDVGGCWMDLDGVHDVGCMVVVGRCWMMLAAVKTLKIFLQKSSL